MDQPPAPPAHPSFAEATRTWLKIGLLGFGGPAGQIALMHKIVVEEKRWIGEERFLHALNYCMLLPGPEAQQLATYIGWLLHRTWGGVVAGTLFVLPGFLVILALSTVYALFHGTPALETLFFGLKAAVLAVVVEAVLRVGRRALKNRVMVALAGLAFVAIFFLGVPFPLIVLAAAVIGLIGGRLRPDLFLPAAKAGAAAAGAAAFSDLASGFASVSMVAMTSLLVTVPPSALTILTSTPACGAGVSSTTLSVSMSTRFSSRLTYSPVFLCHDTSVASATDSESWGTFTSTSMMTP